MKQEHAPDLPDDLSLALRASWHRYVDLLKPIRPDLYRYCRRLTGNVWDAEDLVQDTLERAFATLGKIHPGVEKPRPYLLRVATNAWIDTLRRRDTEARALALQPTPEAASAPSGELRDAGAALLQTLPPQERAAILLKEVFELSVEETADVLETSAAAVKSALHRARGRLREPEPRAARRAPSQALVERFVERFNARDLPGLTRLLLEDASVEQLGCAYASGRTTLERDFLNRALYGHPEWPAELQYEASRLELAHYRGEPIALGLVVRHGREALEQVMRFEEEDGSLARLRTYAFCPEAMREIGSELGIHVRTGLYRYPTPAPGRTYGD